AAGADGPQLHGAEAIVASSIRMNNMIQELVDAARLDVGQIELHRQCLELRTFVRDVVERLNSLSSPARIRVQALEELPPLEADPDRLERILTNLISN